MKYSSSKKHKDSKGTQFVVSKNLIASLIASTDIFNYTEKCRKKYF